MHLDKNKIKENLKIDDIKKILGALGSKEPRKDREGNLIFQTVCHSGHKHKLYYYEESKSFHCYTDCAESFDIYELVIKAKNVNFPSAVRYVAEQTGCYYILNGYREHEDQNKIDDWKWINKSKPKNKLDIELPKYDSKILEVFLPYGYEEWEKEGISLQSQNHFNVMYYVKNDSVIIPHYDTEDNLVGIRQRNTNEEEIKNGRKYTPVIVENKLYNHPLGMNLYGLNKTVGAIKRTKKIMLFEGEKSIMKAQDLYDEFNFTCATCSSNISNFQKDIILNLGVEELFIAFDKYGEKEENTEKVLAYQERLLKFAKMFAPYIRTYILWDDSGLLDYKDSPIDQGKKVFEKLMSSKYEILT